MLDSEVNSVINDIMTSEASSVFLICPAEYNRIDLLRELCNRYYKYYRFNPVIDDFSRLSVTIGEKVLDKDDPKLTLIKGADVCEHGGTTAALSAVLKNIESEERGILFVFDAINLLAENYDYSEFIYLIKHAPRNLKIVLSATAYFKIDFSKLDPTYPLIIDEKGLALKRSLYTYKEYLAGLDDDQKAFLSYVAGFPFVSGSTVSSFLPEGEAVLKFLARRGVYAYQYSVGADECYVLESGLREYLLSLDGCEGKDYAAISYEDRYFRGVIERGALTRDLTLALYLHRLDYAEIMIENRCSRNASIFELYSYAKAHVNLICESIVPGEAKGLNLLLAFAYAFKGTDLYDVVMSEELLREFDQEGTADYLYYGALWILISALDRENDSAKIDKYVGIIKGLLDSGKIQKENLILALTYTDNRMARKFFSLADAENRLHDPEAKKAIWYPKYAEVIALQYAKVGNYRKAVGITEELKEVLPGYIAPSKIKAAKLFSDGPDACFDGIRESIEYARERNDYSEMALLYAVMAVGNYHKGDDEASERFIKGAMAFTSDGKDDMSRFFAIMARSLLLSLKGDVERAIRIAKLSLMYAERYYPQFVVQTAAAYAYALYKMGDNEAAYTYALRAVQASGGNRSCAWMLATGIVANHLFSAGDMRDIDNIVGNMFRVVESHGLTMVVASFSEDVFSQLLSYAKLKGIEPGAIAKIDALIAEGRNAPPPQNVLKVRMFGDVVVTANGESIQWKTRKSKELFLHYILAGPMGIDRNVIIDYLWKGYLYESAINNLKTTNNIIRNTLTRHNIDFKLQYVNSRYILTIDNVDSDYDQYKQALNNFNKTDDIPKKMQYMRKMIDLYKADLATDLTVPDFQHERISVKQEMIITLLKFVRLLTKEEEYTEAKSFLGGLILIDRNNDYTAMMSELDRYIQLTGN